MVILCRVGVPRGHGVEILCNDPVEAMRREYLCG
jgi:hypothetical protein